MSKTFIVLRLRERYDTPGVCGNLDCESLLESPYSRVCFPAQGYPNLETWLCLTCAEYALAGYFELEVLE